MKVGPWTIKPTPFKPQGCARETGGVGIDRDGGGGTKLTSQGRILKGLSAELTFELRPQLGEQTSPRKS